MTPSPSHPRRSAIKFGINTRQFIARTNDITTRVNRFRLTSCLMYLEVNHRTHLEISRTVILTAQLVLSITSGMQRDDELIDVNLHSTRYVSSFCVERISP